MEIPYKYVLLLYKYVLLYVIIALSNRKRYNCVTLLSVGLLLTKNYIIILHPLHFIKSLMYILQLQE